MLRLPSRAPLNRLVITRRALPRSLLHTTVSRRRELFDPSQIERASDDVDVCIVGAGPAGLSAAIRLKQLEAEKGNEIRVVVLEKGAEVGKAAHILEKFSSALYRL
jgi:electron-transferring-flavoprotein dehydrogenase